MILSFLKKLFGKLFHDKLLHVAFDSGEKHKPTIILLHGIAATSNTWAHLIDQLDTEKYRVIAIDLLGFGNSPKPYDKVYDVYDHSLAVRKTIEKLNVKQPFILVGHSMGAIIAAHFASSHSQSVKGLLLVSLPLYVKDDELFQSAFSQKHTDAYLFIYQQLSNNKDFTIKLSKKIRDFLRINDGIEVTNENWVPFRKSLVNTIIKQNTLNDIKKCNMPISVIYGALDGFLIHENMKKLTNFGNVKITKVPAAHHSVSPRIARIIYDEIENLG